MEIQNISFDKILREGESWVYHVHGVRQGWGTCKLHCRPDCPVLENWTPGRNLGKIIMQDSRIEAELSENNLCKVCWK